MSMLVKTVIADVRRTLIDQHQQSYRWPNAELYKYLSDAEREIFSKRGDLFLTSAGNITATVDYSSPGVTLEDVTSDTTAVIIDESNREALVGLVVARALERDSSDVENARRAAEMRQRSFLKLGVTA